MPAKRSKPDITILAVGDRADFDAYKKFIREKTLAKKYGFDCLSLNYRRFLTSGIPRIKTKKVLVLLFFPFSYWNKHIEHKNYKGTYGSKTFYNKFISFWKKVELEAKKHLRGKEVHFINLPGLCGKYRDKLEVSKRLFRKSIAQPELYNRPNIANIQGRLDKGQELFLKPRFGSMGKGITFLSKDNWQTNFISQDGRFKNRKGDSGWHFNDITNNRRVLKVLLKKDILVQRGVVSLILKKNKVDLRIYTFFNKVLYVYPRRNKPDRITTNISQGAPGDPGLLKKIPQNLIVKAKKTALKATKAFGLKFAGVDICLDKNLRDVYIIDVNLFSGFPKSRTFNLARSMIEELNVLVDSGGIAFTSLKNSL